MSLLEYTRFVGSSFSNLSVASPTSKFILQPFRRFTYVTAHSPTLPLLHLRHSSFSNPSFASPKSQALYLGLLYVTWRAAHAPTVYYMWNAHFTKHIQEREVGPFTYTQFLSHSAQREIFPLCFHISTLLHHHYHNVLPKGRSFPADSRTKTAVLPGIK